VHDPHNSDEVRSNEPAPAPSMKEITLDVCVQPDQRLVPQVREAFTATRFQQLGGVSLPHHRHEFGRRLGLPDPGEGTVRNRSLAAALQPTPPSRYVVTVDGAAVAGMDWGPPALPGRQSARDTMEVRRLRTQGGAG